MQTIRQAFILLRQNPLLSAIFILGTAFAITMIMAIVITWQMKYADIEPEVNRSRSLYISKMHLQGKENKGWNNYTACSPAFMKDCVQPLPEVEACTAFVPATVALVSMPDGTNAVKVDAMETDPGFWKVFRMQFVAGRGFDDSDRGGEIFPFCDGGARFPESDGRIPAAVDFPRLYLGDFAHEGYPAGVSVSWGGA